MGFSALSIALALALLAGYAGLAARAHRVSPRARAAGLTLLTGGAFAFHVDLLQWQPGSGLSLRLPPAHLHEIFHHYLGTKYFAELGYTGLYEAAVVADFEDEPENFRPEGPLRDLESNELRPRGSALAEAERIKAPFSAERWAAFKRDLAPIRRAHTPERWQLRGYYIDHGYNGSPLVTALLGGLAQQPWLDSVVYLDLMRRLDPYLLVLVGVVVAGLEGAVAGLTFLFFLFANPLNEYIFIGGGYLRYNYLIALALAFVALRRGLPAASGVCFALAGWLRLFPLAFPAVLLVQDLAHPRRRDALRAHRRLYLAFALASVAILLGTSLVSTPDGRNPWLGFADNIALHADTPSVNRIGLEVPFLYAPSKDVHSTDVRFGPAPADWVRNTQRLHERRRGYTLAAAGLLLALAGWGLRREREGGFTTARFAAGTFVTGMVVIFALLPLSHYYYAMLGLFPLAAGNDRRLLLLLAATFAVLAFTGLPFFLSGFPDLLFALFSLEILAFLLAALWLLRDGRRRAAGLGALALACLCASLPACSGEPEPQDRAARLLERKQERLREWRKSMRKSPPPPLELAGNTYESKALGFSITKPADWVFLPESSLGVDPTPERLRNVAELWKILYLPGSTPLVAMAADPERDPGDPAVVVFAIPMRPGDVGLGQATGWGSAPQRVALGRARQRATAPNIELVEDAHVLELSGAPVGAAAVAVTLEDGDGHEVRTFERWLYFERGREGWWILLNGPYPLTEEVQEVLDSILASVRIDP